MGHGALSCCHYDRGVAVVGVNLVFAEAVLMIVKPAVFILPLCCFFFLFLHFLRAGPFNVTHSFCFVLNICSTITASNHAKSKYSSNVGPRVIQMFSRPSFSHRVYCPSSATGTVAILLPWLRRFFFNKNKPTNIYRPPRAHCNISNIPPPRFASFIRLSIGFHSAQFNLNSLNLFIQFLNLFFFLFIHFSVPFFLLFALRAFPPHHFHRPTRP